MKDALLRANRKGNLFGFLYFSLKNKHFFLFDLIEKLYRIKFSTEIVESKRLFFTKISPKNKTKESKLFLILAITFFHIHIQMKEFFHKQNIYVLLVKMKAYYKVITFWNGYCYVIFYHFYVFPAFSAYNS